tara:strand:- start:7460 stop:8362 length:903 start_codon:yes stop_codon:yes gene_type:complete
MIYRIGWLGALLCAQLVIVAAVLLLDARETASGDAAPLLVFEAPDVDRITVGEGESVAELSRTDDGWLVAGSLAADAAKVQDALEKLGGLRPSWPVATSPEIQERFELAPDNYQRRIRLFGQGEVLADLFLGSSPGYRRVHGRVSGSDEIYSLDLSTFEFPSSQGDWLDKAQLGAKGAVSGVARAGAWSLSKGEAGWVLEGQADERPEELDQAAADRVADRIAGLRFMDVADSAPSGNPEIVSITDESGDYELQFWHDPDADEYVLASSRAEDYFEVASYIAEQVLVGRSALMADADVDE